MSERRDILPVSLPPRLLTRELAAACLSVSTYIFDSWVGEGRMPLPKAVGTKRLWDRLAIDRAVESLPDKHGRTPNGVRFAL